MAMSLGLPLQHGNDYMSENQEWVLCQEPATGDILRWNEPLWAKPNKPRGRPDKIGEQQITATLVTIGNLLEFKVLSVTKLSPGEAPLKVKEGDNIQRKKTSIEKGACHKRLR